MDSPRSDILREYNVLMLYRIFSAGVGRNGAIAVCQDIADHADQPGSALSVSERGLVRENVRPMSSNHRFDSQQFDGVVGNSRRAVGVDKIDGLISGGRFEDVTQRFAGGINAGDMVCVGRDGDPVKLNRRPLSHAAKADGGGGFGQGEAVPLFIKRPAPVTWLCEHAEATKRRDEQRVQ